MTNKELQELLKSYDDDLEITFLMTDCKKVFESEIADIQLDIYIKTPIEKVWREKWGNKELFLEGGAKTDD